MAEEEVKKIEPRGQIPDEKDMCYCEKERTWSKSNNFYQYKDGSKTKMCKRCLTMHVDNFDPETFTWILKDLDVPYIPEKWNTLRDRAFAKNPNLTGISVVGKYLSAMKIKPWTNYGWDDTEMLLEMNKAKVRKETEEEIQERHEYEQKLRNDLAEGKISKAEYQTLMPTEIQNAELAPTDSKDIDAAVGNRMDQDAFISETDLPNPAADLTDDDKKYLAMKWGRLYKPNEWVQLESNYVKMAKKFGISDETPDSQNTLITICKVNLKMNQALDMGDLDGFSKLTRTYESLRKSANFTAAQNKVDKDGIFDAIGQVVAFCEKEGGKIPHWNLEVPLDIVDKDINDMKEYYSNLVKEDPSLSREIEDYMKKKEIQESQKRDRQEAKSQGLNYVPVTDQDMADFEEFKAAEAAKDAGESGEEES